MTMWQQWHKYLLEWQWSVAALYCWLTCPVLYITLHIVGLTQYCTINIVLSTQYFVQVHFKFNHVQWLLYSANLLLHRLEIGGCVGVLALEDQILWGAGSKRSLVTSFKRGYNSCQKLCKHLRHWFFNWLSDHFPSNLENIINHKSNFERMFTPHNMSHVTCHMSYVICHMSTVMCHMSCVTCPIYFVIFIYFFYLDKVVKLIRGVSVINGAYPV